jgi:CO/xanthine dehydrogenase FAD-binding subunit
MMHKKYIKPDYLRDALQILSGGKATILAGGTDLLVIWRKLADSEKPKMVIDISELSELKGITDEGGWIRVGAAATYRELVNDPLIKEYADVLSEAAFSVGSTQIRNRGTIGGSLGNASPAADLAPVLVLLDAELELLSLEKGKRRVCVSDFLQGNVGNSLAENELITAIRIRKVTKHNQVFNKIGRRNAVAIARLSGACIMQMHDDRIENVKLVIGAATPSPLSMEEELGSLIGKKPSEEDFAKVASQVVARVKEISGVRESAKWKFPAVEKLALNLLLDAAKIGGGSDE